MERKRFTVAGAEFSAPNPVGAAIYARLKENATDDLRSLGATDKQLASDNEWLRWLKKLLDERPMKGTLCILESLLRPESGVSVLDAFESDTKGDCAAPLNFFTESMKALLPVVTRSAPVSQNSRKAPRKRKA